jgi:hypothetical protein
MIEQTRKKLREAQFFHRHLVRESERSNRPEPDAFDFYLSAFLSAGRSVTFVLQNEEKEKYDGWFPSWRAGLTQEESNLLRFVNEQRVAELKRLGAKTVTSVEFVAVRELEQEGHGHPAYGHHDFSPPGTEPAKTGFVVSHFEIEGNLAKAVETCSQYLRLCERLVQDFISAHG